jgi:NTE family protein
VKWLKLKLLYFFLLFAPMAATAQSVGVVLSGGGATGLTHIGVLKALEENNIPIDYITGTSAGAMVGGMYACGLPPEVIDSIVNTEVFRLMAEGKIESRYIYYFKEPENDGSWLTLKFAKDSILQTTIPTNLITPTLMDFQMMTGFSGGAAAANYDFDSLFVPFRCVAADVAAHESVVFKDGFLNEEIRASMSYPFYLKPIVVRGKLLFDGGLYNNFPSNVMYDEFLPDIIIGSSVSSGSVQNPGEDDLLSQIKSMILNRSDESIQCENGIIVRPQTDISTFDFSQAEEAIKAGYDATMAKMDSIKLLIQRRVTREELMARRMKFRMKAPPLIFGDISIDGLNKKQASYVKKMLEQKSDSINPDDLKSRYFRVFADEKIKFIYPKAKFNDSTGLYDLNLQIKKEKEFVANFGGNFSSKPINTGFLGVEYNYLGKYALNISANSYFGKFYGSVQGKIRMDFATKVPFYVEPVFTLNRWDYFKSAATFFEDVRPSFLVQNEQFYGINFGLPVVRKGRLKLDVKYYNMEDDYYQTTEFTSLDTADITEFYGYTTGLMYERSTLNRKQYASEGTYLAISGRFVNGTELSMPGSTSATLDTFTDIHNWVLLKLEYDNYFKRKGKFKFGFHTEGVFSTQPFFNNYTATILSAQAFQPIPESKTLMQEEFRAYKYATAGLKAIYNIKGNFDFRLEGYVYQPVNRILANPDNKAFLGVDFENRYYIASAVAVYHSPLGPLSITANYYNAFEEQPWSFLFNFGYVIFNQRAIK